MTQNTWNRALGWGLAPLMVAFLGACQGAAEVGPPSLLGTEIPADFTFETAQTVQVDPGALTEQKVELHLQTGEKIYEGPASLLKGLEFTIPSYQHQLHLTADQTTVDLKISSGVAHR